MIAARRLAMAFPALEKLFRIVSLYIAALAAADTNLPYGPLPAPAGSSSWTPQKKTNLIGECKEKYRDVNLDHFSRVRGQRLLGGLADL